MPVTRRPPLRAPGEQRTDVGPHARVGDAVARIDQQMRAPLSIASSTTGAVDPCSSRAYAVRGRTVDARAGSTQPVDLHPAGDGAPADREQQGGPVGRRAAVHHERLADADHGAELEAPTPATRTSSAAMAVGRQATASRRARTPRASPSPSMSKRGSARSSQAGIHHAPDRTARAPRGSGSSAPGTRRSRRRPPVRTRSAGWMRPPRARTPRTPRT